ncbi:MAG: hypothetical protein WD058_07480 [Dehalococcoidia bacterium]
MARAYPPEHPLGSAAAKVERAEAHINELTRSISDTSDPDITVTAKGNLKGEGDLSGRAVHEVTIEPRDPTTWSLMIGDAVTNLRSSLDHIAWALAQERARRERRVLTVAEERGISFPLGDLPDSFGVSRVIIDEAVPVIESFQPYNRAQRPELELLGILDEISRTDKHRLIIAIERRVRIRVSDKTWATKARLDEAYRQWVIWNDFSPANDLEPDGAFDITVNPSIRDGAGFSALELSDVHDLIRDEVLPAFARFFPQ